MYSLPDLKSLRITDITFEIVDNHLFLVYQSVTKYGDKSKDGHWMYQCPFVYNNTPCKTHGRYVNAHHCTGLKVAYAAAGDSSTDASSTPDPEERAHIISRLVLDQASPSKKAFMRFVAKRQPAFSLLSSSEFNTFIQTVITEARLHPRLPAKHIFPILTYRGIRAMIMKEAKKERSALRKQWKGSTLNVMFDGGKIGQKHYTVVCVKPLDCPGEIRFWRLKKKCRKKDNFIHLLKDLQTEFATFGATIGAVTIDGEAAQRFALQDTLKSPQFEQEFPNTHFKPLHVYCRNHLVNLSFQDVFETSTHLSAIKTSILNFVRAAHQTGAAERLGGSCPTFTDTRWLALIDICQFIRSHRDKIIAEQFLKEADVYEIFRFELLISPLMDLQKILEASTSTMSDVFPAVITTLDKHTLLMQNPLFQNQSWMLSLREVMRYLYNRLLAGDRGNETALAYALTPAGMEAFRRMNFTDHDTLDKYIQKQEWKKVSNHDGIKKLSQVYAESIYKAEEATTTTTTSSSSSSSASSSSSSISSNLSTEISSLPEDVTLTQRNLTFEELLSASRMVLDMESKLQLEETSDEISSSNGLQHAEENNADSDFQQAGKQNIKKKGRKLERQEDKSNPALRAQSPVMPNPLSTDQSPQPPSHTRSLQTLPLPEPISRPFIFPFYPIPPKNKRTTNSSSITSHPILPTTHSQSSGLAQAQPVKPNATLKDDEDESDTSSKPIRKLFPQRRSIRPYLNSQLSQDSSKQKREVQQHITDIFKPSGDQKKKEKIASNPENKEIPKKRKMRQATLISHSKKHKRRKVFNVTIDPDALVEGDNQSSIVGEDESSFSEPSEDSAAEADQEGAIEEEEEHDVEVVFQNTTIPFEAFTSLDREIEIINLIVSRIHGDWELGLRSGFEKYVEKVLSTKNTTDKEELKQLFQVSLSSYSAPPVSQNPFVYYERMQVANTRNITYSVICMSLLNASCSEASCERVFSILRYIVGDRRRSLTKRRLNDLLMIR